MEFEYLKEVKEIVKAIIPPEAEVSSVDIEGPEIAVYTKRPKAFHDNEDYVKALAQQLKKKINIRVDKSLLMDEKQAKEKIMSLVPADAKISDVQFMEPFSEVLIEALKPGLVIGKGGHTTKDIIIQTGWTPNIVRSPTQPSEILTGIRRHLVKYAGERKKMLQETARKIYSEKCQQSWIRLTPLGGFRQVGRSCIMVETRKTKILLDCGVNVSAQTPEEEYPYLDAIRFPLNELDSVVLSHAHMDHCLPPHAPVLTENGYKEIDKIVEGEKIIAMDWQTGRQTIAKCSGKTRTKEHKKILSINTPYSRIEASPNHTFFTSQGLKIVEMHASELKEKMLLPSNLLNKPLVGEKEVMLDTNIEYDKRREDTYTLPEVLSPELAEFIGYYVGDGHKSSDFALRLTDSSTQLLEHHKKLVKEIFNYNAVIRHHSDKSKNAHILEVANAKVIKFIERNFPETMLKTRFKVVPQKILVAPRAVQAGFLRGLADADGTITNSVKITSVSGALLEGLQHMFSSLEIPSNINYKDNSICLASKFSIAKFHEKIGFASNEKQMKLDGKVNSFAEKDFDHEDLVPITPIDLRNILKDAGMLGRVHNSPKLSEILPMGLLDLFRRKSGYATRKTAKKLLALLEGRAEELEMAAKRLGAYDLKQFISVTRQETANATGMKAFQVQQIEESALAVGRENPVSGFVAEKALSMIIQTRKNIGLIQDLLSMEATWEKITKIKEIENPYPYLVDIEVENYHNFITGNIVVHNCGFIPYLFKMGYRGPVYMSVDYAEPVMIKEDNRVKVEKIGQTIDRIIDSADNPEYYPENDYMAAQPKTDLFVPSFSKDKKMSFKKVQKVIRHKVNGDIFEIVTRNKRSVKVTGSHSVFVLKKGKIIDAKVSELKIGDYLVAPHNLPSNNDTVEEIDLAQYNGKETRVKLPPKIKVSTELMKILGYFTAEGHFEKRAIRYTFGLKDRAIVEELKNAFRQVFNIETKDTISQETRIRVAVNSKDLLNLFKKEFFPAYKKATSKRIPEIIFNVKDEFKLAFLESYFEGDGTINHLNQTAQASTVSKDLASDLSYLCSQLGLTYSNFKIMEPKAKTKNPVYYLTINLSEFFRTKRLDKKGCEILPLKEIGFGEEWFYHRLKARKHVTKQRLKELLNKGWVKNGNKSLMLMQEVKNKLIEFAETDLAFLPITEINQVKPTNGYVYDFSVEGDQNFVGGEAPICLHNTEPTRDLAALLLFDYIDITVKENRESPFAERDVKEMLKYCITREYREVTDIANDIRITFHDSSHILGGGSVHLHIGEGAHNLVYSADIKYGFTRLFNNVDMNYPRLETLVLESTYGAKEDVKPSREETEAQLLKVIQETVNHNGNVLIPVFAVGRAQELQLVLENYYRKGLLDPEARVYVDGLTREASAIHTAYPEYLRSVVQKRVLQNDSPFTSDIFHEAKPEDRDSIVKQGKAIILASSGMLTGGASLAHFYKLAENPINTLIFVGYQGEGSLGRKIQQGLKTMPITENGGRTRKLDINLRVETLDGFSVPYETEVFVKENGEFRLEQIGKIADRFIGKDEEGVGDVHGLEVAAFNKHGKIEMAQASHIIKHRAKEKHLKITTKSGKEVQVSKGHSLFTLKNGEIKDIKGGKLTEGNTILIAGKLPQPNSISEVEFSECAAELGYELKENRYEPKKGGNNRSFINTMCNDMHSLAKFLGYYAAEGHKEKGRGHRAVLSFGSHEAETIKDACQSIEKSFGVKPTFINPHQTETQIRVANKVLVKFLEKIGVGENALTKRVPQMVFNLPYEAQKEFLKAYFAGDGYDYKNGAKGYLAAKSASKKLLSDLSYLLLQHGIIARLKGPFKEKERELNGHLMKGSIAYKLYIAEKEFEKIERNIGLPPFALPIKEIRLEKLARLINNHDLKKLAYDYISNYKNKGRKYIGKQIVKKMLASTNYGNATPEEQNLIFTLKSLIDGDIATDEVVKIEETEKPEYEYDLSVPDRENFCGGNGGVILHNSGHSDRNELISYVRSLKPKPKRILVNHGEASKCVELSRYISAKFAITCQSIRNLDTVRLK